MKVTVMGLGLNGGGLASAVYFAKRGDEVTVTDLRDETVLAPTLEQLKPYPIRYVLGEHRIEDFQNADCVIKNPAVKKDSPFLQPFFSAAAAIRLSPSPAAKENQRQPAL